MPLPWVRVLSVVVIVAMAPAAVRAQAARETPPLTSVFDGSTLRDLPSSDSLFSTLETTHAPVVSDRFSTGLNPAEPARLGAFLTSWTQTTFRIGDVDITSPQGAVPMFVPVLALWQGVAVTAGLVPGDVSGAGVLVTLDPHRLPAAWTTDAEVAGSWNGLVASPADRAPAMTRAGTWSHARVVVGGPLRRARGGIVLAAATTRSSQFERGRAAAVDAGLDSVFANVTLTGQGSELRTLGVLQAARSPLEHEIPYVQSGSRQRDTSVHVQTTWARRVAGRAPWRVFGAVTQRSRGTTAILPSTAIVERVLDGVPEHLAAPAPGVERRWTSGIRAEQISKRAFGLAHVLDVGADGKASHVDVDATDPVTVGERVGGIPARIWIYSRSATAHRSKRELAVFARDQIAIAPRLTLDGVLRFDSVSGRARGAREGISWNTWLPRVAVRWRIADTWRASAFGSYARAADVLPLSVLAFGDPAAPVSEIRRWNGSTSGPVIARGGPGAGTDLTLTTIDPDVRRPMANEFAAGVEIAPGMWPRLRVTALRKLATDQLALVNVGVSSSDYSVSTIFDPGPNVLDPVDDQQLPIYDRLPASFGRDRFLLTTPSQSAATFRGLVFNIDGGRSRTFISAGGTLGWTHGRAGNRGFGADENDLGAIGEGSADPNALTHARGNLFSDRQYTVKIAGVQRFGRDVRVGAIARYQDGQAFSRVVVVPGLNQGAEAIRAFRSGKSRFTYTGTLDVRVAKGVALGGNRRVVLILDAYNVVNMAKEVEEWVVTGPDFRTPTAVQPPRVFHVGVRFSL